MEPTDDRMREILEIKEHLTKKAEEHEVELEYIRRNIAILDSLLKKSSFARASELKRKPDEAPDAPADEPAAGDPGVPPGATPIVVDDKPVAHIMVGPEEITIRISDGVRLTPDMPPLQTFFVDKIIGGMRKKDSEHVRAGKLDEASVVTCDIRENGGAISEIVVKSYREESRANDIVNSLTWALARMAENSMR